MFRPLVVYVTTPPERGHQQIVAVIDAITAVDGINAGELGNPAHRWRLVRARGRVLVHVIAGEGLSAAAGLAARKHWPLLITVPRGWKGQLPDAAVVICDPHDADRFTGARTRAIDLSLGTAGARAADLEEQWVAVARGGLAPQRAPMRSTPSVDVVVVTHNRADLLEQTLGALDAQTYREREVTVVDNASTDRTPQILAAWGGATIRFDEHQPVVVARNTAVASMSGEVIAFTDDDCRPDKDWLRSLVAAFSDGVGIVQGKTISDRRADVGPLSRTQVMPAEAGLYETCNIAYRREVFESVHGFDTGLAAVIERTLRMQHPFGEDTDLAWRAKSAGAVSRFASDAVVEHHVFAPDPRYILRRSLISAAFPVLLKRIPPLRRDLLTFGFLLGPRRVLWWLAVLGGALSFLTPWTLLLVLPYLRWLVAPQKPRRWRRIRVLPFQIVRDLVESVALLYGSLRARRLVL